MQHSLLFEWHVKRLSNFGSAILFGAFFYLSVLQLKAMNAYCIRLNSECTLDTIFSLLFLYLVCPLFHLPPLPSPSQLQINWEGVVPDKYIAANVKSLINILWLNIFHYYYLLLVFQLILWFDETGRLAHKLTSIYLAIKKQIRRDASWNHFVFVTITWISTEKDILNYNDDATRRDDEVHQNKNEKRF